MFTADQWLETGSALQNLDGVGIGTASDAFNKLSVAAQATLLSHDGAGHQLKLNKAAAGTRLRCSIKAVLPAMQRWG